MRSAYRIVTPPKAWAENRHVASAETVDATLHRVTFHEKAIGCENCHGPGSLHQEFHRTRKLLPGQDDSTIVHPGKLARPLQEALLSRS